MPSRVLRAAVAALAGTVLLVPATASAGPVCEGTVHVVEEEVVEPVDEGLAQRVHAVEETACPFLP
jgi:hypothetical protein